MSKEKKDNMKRVNINIPISLYEKVKQYADEMGINVTSSYIVLLNYALEYKELIKQLPSMTYIANKLNENKRKEEND